MRRSEDSDSSEARRGEGSPLGRERERAQLVLLGAESVLAFVFWCIFTELIPTVRLADASISFASSPLLVPNLSPLSPPSPSSFAPFFTLFMPI